MACEGQANREQTRQQICTCWLASKWASRESWWLGGEEEPPRAGEWLATKSKDKQLGIANNCIPPGNWRGREIFCQTALNCQTSAFSTLQWRLLRQPSLCASRRLFRSTCRLQLSTGNTSSVSRKAQGAGAGACAHTWRGVLESCSHSWAGTAHAFPLQGVLSATASGLFMVKAVAMLPKCWDRQSCFDGLRRSPKALSKGDVINLHHKISK